MDVLEAIHNRASTKIVSDRPVPRDLLEKLLEAAVQAPNHHQNRPWRFWVLRGKAREDLGEVMAESLRQRLPDPDSEIGKASLERERSKPLRAPVLIVVGVEQQSNQPILNVENAAATAAAVQNMLLAAHALGLGAMWRTGQPAYNAAVKAHFGLKPDDLILSFVYVGYPEQQAEARERHVGDRVTWLEFD